METKIPPPLQTLIFGGLMYLLAQVASDFTFAWEPNVNIAADITKNHILGIPITLQTMLISAFVFLGFGVIVAGNISFAQAKTTVNPLNPMQASTLVVVGIFHRTRNPMYLGMLLMLCAWMIYLANPLNILLAVGFVLFITRFQIKPEEKALTELFGEDFTAYCAKVRRWI